MVFRLPTSPTYRAQAQDGPEWVVPGGLPQAPFRIQVLPPVLRTGPVRKVPKSYAGVIARVGGQGRVQQDQARGLRVGEAYVGVGTEGGRERDPTAPQVADRELVRSLRDQLDLIAQTPPLTLLINPESFSVTRTKVQNLQDRSRYGYVYQPWGFEDPEAISFTVRCGAFITPGRGVQRASRQDSAAWQQLESLLEIFSSGGSLFDPQGEVTTPVAVGQTLVSYDGWRYRGQLEQLVWGEDEQDQLGGARIEIQMVADLIQDEEATTGPIVQVQTGPTTAEPVWTGLVPRPWVS